VGEERERRGVWKQRGRGIERERKRERERERETDPHTYTERERERETERPTDIHTYTHIHTLFLCRLVKAHPRVELQPRAKPWLRFYFYVCFYFYFYSYSYVARSNKHAQIHERPMIKQSHYKTNNKSVMYKSPRV
jgi:hypothetical protein